MTSPSLRKGQITARGPITRATKLDNGNAAAPHKAGLLRPWAPLLVLVTELLAVPALAQDFPRRLPTGLLTKSLFAPKATQTTMHFSRGPVGAAVQKETAPPPGGEIEPVQAGERKRYGRPRKDIEEIDAPTYGDMPGPDRLFRRESEDDWKDRVRQDERRRPGADKVEFPQEPPMPREAFAPRSFPPATAIAEPCYVPHCRIIFEQPNFERLGYDFGFFQPMVSTGVFCFDILTMPYQYCKRPFQQFDCSAGKPLPGDDAPLLLYPVEPSLTGLIGEGLMVTGIVFAFP